MEHFSIWIEAFSGLGLFMFGMLFVETQIKASAGRAFKKIVQSATQTSFKGLLTGIGATAIFQSSSVVTLMTLSLVGAQLMSLQSGIAVIFGSNVGTTITAWIVALIGFSMDIKLLSYAAIGIGGLGQVMVGDSSRWKHYFGVLIGFGLIFLGLEGMKDSFSVFSKSFDIASFAFSNPYWYLLLGLALTAVIQSSSATIAIVQSALYTNIIGFEQAAVFVIGANIGTTVTALLGAFGGTADKKRVAFAHLVFNLSTGLSAVLLLPFLLFGVDYIASSQSGVVRIAIFHTVFNVLGVLLWYAFIPSLSRFVQRYFHKKKETTTHFIDNVSTKVPEIALDALQKEIQHLTQKIEDFALLAINVPPPKVFEEKMAIDKTLEKYQQNFDVTYEKLYEHIRTLEGEIYRYASELSRESQNEVFSIELTKEITKVSYLATAAKVMKDILYDLDLFYNSTTNEEQSFYKNMRYQILKTVQIFHQANSGDDESFTRMEELYKKIAESYKKSTSIIEDLAKNHSISSHVTTMAINDMHSIKSFSKSMRNALGKDEE